jgi:hypothetical protein
MVAVYSSPGPKSLVCVDVPKPVTPSKSPVPLITRSEAVWAP